VSLASLLTHVVSVQRQTAGAGVTKTWTTVLTNVPVMIQQIDPAPAEGTGSSWGKDFKGFLRLAEDVREGDRLTAADGTIYSVKGVKKRNYGTSMSQHLEVLLGVDGSKA
jgi:hypothetical protein